MSDKLKDKENKKSDLNSSLITLNSLIFKVSFPLVGNPSEERLRTCLPDRQASRSDNQDYGLTE